MGKFQGEAKGKFTVRGSAERKARPIADEPS